MTLSVSRLYNVNGRMIDECGAGGVMRIGRESTLLRGNRPQYHSVQPQIRHDLTGDRTRAATVYMLFVCVYKSFPHTVIIPLFSADIITTTSVCHYAVINR
jgi:hypothetical protein